MNLSAKRIYQLLIALVVLSVVALAGCTYAAKQVLDDKSKDVYNAKLQSMALEAQQADINKAKEDIQRYRNLAEIAKNIVPQDKDQARTVREISKLAEDNGIAIGSITFPSSSLGNRTSGAINSQLERVKDIPGTYSLQITVRSPSNQPAPYPNFINFLEALEQNRRTALVKGVTITPKENNPEMLDFTLVIEVYIKP